MNSRHLAHVFLLVMVCIGYGCANIVPPSGGKKDVIPPKMVSVEPADSLLNTRVTRVELYFDEYITTSDVSKEVEISPILAIPPVVTSLNKHVIVKIPDSLLEENTTYRISFGKAIKDVHEGNPFKNYAYTFSTGSYFDSLEISGSVINAATGLADSGSVYVVLYSASKSDSAVVREKPKYVAKADGNGNFSLKGLPDKKFHIYALRDGNENLIYDGGAERIAFNDKPVRPGDTLQEPIQLRLFAEPDDTGAHLDSLSKNDTARSKGGKPGMGGFSDNKRSKTIRNKGQLGYVVQIDTADVKKRSFDVTLPAVITFNDTFAYNKDHIKLDYDSLGTQVEVAAKIYTDSAIRNTLFVNTAWKDNTVYTLKLAKGFAKDTAGKDVSPSHYTFRTQREDDYAKLELHLPGKYLGSPYVLRIMKGTDSIYQKPVTDTIVRLTYLKVASYGFRIIVDKNHNGKWDPGNLFKKIQPEYVIPFKDGTTTLKAGWENIVDFEKPQTNKPGLKAKKPPPVLKK